MKVYTADVVILGAGMVALSIAYQLKQSNSNISILIVDKESEVGLHSSGRNSGVLHAGVYYPPSTLKAQVCVNGARRLKEWCISENIPILQCGKVISPQSPELDPQLDLLLDRGRKNGAKVELIDQSQFNKLVPFGRTTSGRALWSPSTSVVSPKTVIRRLVSRLRELGVQFLFETSPVTYFPDRNNLYCSSKNSSTIALSYGHLYNATGLQADRVAHLFDVGLNYKLLPFKGIYWKLDPSAPFKFSCNLYPVPDLNVPFLGVHVTPSPSGEISLGPTAIPALGRENYYGLQDVEPMMLTGFIADLAKQWISNSGGFRRYAKEQALHGLKPLFVKAAQALVPGIQSKHLLPSKKVGIRAQLYDNKNETLVQDFCVEHGPSSTHVLNAISPAFTASFALADLIIERSSFSPS